MINFCKSLASNLNESPFLSQHRRPWSTAFAGWLSGDRLCSAAIRSRDLHVEFLWHAPGLEPSVKLLVPSRTPSAWKCHPARIRARRTAVGQECPTCISGSDNATPFGETDRRNDAVNGISSVIEFQCHPENGRKKIWCRLDVLVVSDGAQSLSICRLAADLFWCGHDVF